MKTATVPRPQYARLEKALAAIADLLEDVVPAVGVPKQNVKEAREVAVRALKQADILDALAHWVAEHEEEADDWPTGCAECQPLRAALAHAYGED